jgi:hypothetical protein
LFSTNVGTPNRSAMRGPPGAELAYSEPIASFATLSPYFLPADDGIGAHAHHWHDQDRDEQPAEQRLAPAGRASQFLSSVASTRVARHPNFPVPAAIPVNVLRQGMQWEVRRGEGKVVKERLLGVSRRVVFQAFDRAIGNGTSGAIKRSRGSSENGPRDWVSFWPKAESRQPNAVATSWP